MSEPESVPSGLGRATAVMSIGTAMSRATGFARWAALAWAIGGAESKLPDTYQLANTLPNVFYQLILGEVLVTVFVPIFVEYLTTRTRAEAQKLSSSMLTLAFGIATAFSALAIVAAPWIIKIYTFGLDGPDRAAQEEVGAFFLRVFMPQMIFYTTGLVVSGLLNAHRKFAAPMFAPIANNLVVIATFVVFGSIHSAGVPTLQSLSLGEKWLLAGGATLGVAIQTLALVPAVRRLPGAWWRLSDVDLRLPALRRVGRLARYAVGYVIMNQIGLWIVKRLANGVRGGVVAYDASFVLYSLPYGIFAVSVFTALVPALSEYHAKGDLASFRADLSRGIRITSFVVLPASAGFIALSRPIVRLLFEHGVFSAESTQLFADTLALMAIGLWGYAVFQQIMRAFYSMQDTRTPLIVNSAGVVVNVLTAIPLFGVLGVPGLGLSHAISYLLSLAVAAFIIQRRVGSIGGAPLVGWLAKVSAASAATGAVAWITARGVGGVVDTSALGGQVLHVGSAVAVGIAVFVLFAALMRIKELTQMMRLLGRAFGRAS